MKHWNMIYTIGEKFNPPDEGKLILMKMASGRYYTGYWSKQSGFTTRTTASLGETVVKWMYVPEDAL